MQRAILILGSKLLQDIKEELHLVNRKGIILTVTAVAFLAALLPAKAKVRVRGVKWLLVILPLRHRQRTIPGATGPNTATPALVHDGKRFRAWRQQWRSVAVSLLLGVDRLLAGEESISI